MKKIPKFNSIEEETAFWDTHNITDYVGFSKAIPVSFPNLQLTPVLHISTKSTGGTTLHDEFNV